MFEMCIATVIFSIFAIMGIFVTYGLYRWAGGKKNFISFIKTF